MGLLTKTTDQARKEAVEIQTSLTELNTHLKTQKKIDAAITDQTKKYWKMVQKLAFVFPICQNNEEQKKSTSRSIKK